MTAKAAKPTNEPWGHGTAGKREYGEWKVSGEPIGHSLFNELIPPLGIAAKDGIRPALEAVETLALHVCGDGAVE